MQNENPLTPGEQELERALAHLLPALPGDHRDTIAYQAGRRSARRPLLLWRASTLLFASISAVLFLPRRAIPPVPPTLPSAVLTANWTSEAPTHPSSAPYLALRNAVLTQGLDALPPAPATGDRKTRQSPQHAVEIQRTSLQLPAFFGESL